MLFSFKCVFLGLLKITTKAQCYNLSRPSNDVIFNHPQLPQDTDTEVFTHNSDINDTKLQLISFMLGKLFAQESSFMFYDAKEVEI